MISDRSRIRSTIVVLAVLSIAAAAVAMVVVRTTTAKAAVVVAVEDEGADCAVSLPGSLPATSLLPDPFRKLDGTRITARSDWRCRRAEIKELAETYVYGQKPAKPQSVTGTVSNTSITVNVTHNGQNASFSASVQLPTSGSGPFPAIVVLGGFGADTATMRAAGAAVINYDPLAVGREGTPRSNKQGAFYSIYGSSSSTGLLVAWAWGVSRIIDVIEQSGGNILTADATGVTGCSRYGKGAFVAGAFAGGLLEPEPEITSPEGALTSATSATGKATFQFNPQYQPGDSGPVPSTGKVTFRFPAANFSLDSTALEWLVVTADGKAAVKGTATVNGSTGYGFVLYAYDEPDSLRIVVWSLAQGPVPGGDVVYDNVPSAAFDVDVASPQPISHGAITIHR